MQSQEDSLRSLVRWGLLPGARLSLAPRLPSLTPPRPFPAPAPPASRIRRRSPAARSPVLQLPLGLRSFSAPVFSPPRTRVDASQPNWSLCLPSLPTMCTCLSSTPFPKASFAVPGHIPVPLPRPAPHPALKRHLSRNSPFPASLAPSANAAPCGRPLPRPAAQNSLLRPQNSSSPRHTLLSPLSQLSQALCPAGSQPHLSLPGPFISTCGSTGCDRPPSPCHF